MSILIRGDIQGDICNVSVSGELDISNADKLKEKTHSLLDKEIKDVVFDLTNLDYIDSTGLGVMIGVLKRLKLQEKNVHIKNPKDNVRKIFTITGLDKIFIMEG
ncbi:MAG: STAS domain-containing protein [Clostridioides sp.]|jgi:anti-sigma B factor antagonist|nr:STAS domain-containing protein [Clostridioides sp.]